MNTMQFDNDMSPAKRAGDSRRVLAAVKHYAVGDQEGIGAVMAEAKACGRAHHFTYDALERLCNAYGLRDEHNRVNQQRVNEFGVVIDSFAAKENPTENGDNENGEK
ncbi:hypothetical protein [Mycobacterium sp.]|uniref:hypothetical protein n=1 Tax=Mycobacterium sp. TaxID=1785 RepID=UPI003BB152FA